MSATATVYINIDYGEREELRGPGTAEACGVTTKKMHVVWSAARGHDGYRLYRDGAVIAEVDGCDLEFFDTGVSAGQTYTYEIYAFTAVESDDSADDEGTALPNPPTGLTTTADMVTGKIDASWTAPSGTFDDYEFVREGDDGSYTTLSVSSSDTSYSDTTITTDVRYTYKIRCYVDSVDDGRLYSEWAAYSVAIVPTPPLDPVGFDARAAGGIPALGVGEIELSWTSGSFNEDWFVIKRADVMGGTRTEIARVTRSVTTYIDSGLSPGHTYDYEIYATNLAGDSGSVYDLGTTRPDVILPPLYTTTSYFSVPIPVPPFIATMPQIDLGWSYGPGSYDGLLFMRAGSDSSFEEMLSPGAYTTTSDRRVLPGVEYRYEIHTYVTTPDLSEGIVVDGTPGVVTSVPFVLTPPVIVPPPPPMNVSAAGISESEIEITWDPSVGHDGYGIFRDGMFITVLPNTATSYTDVGLTSGSTHFYVVFAFNLGGESPPDDDYGTTMPDAPYNVDASFSTSGLGVELTWDYSTTACAIDGFEITCYGTGTTYTTTVASGDRSIADTSVVAGDTYTYDVCAYLTTTTETPPEVYSAIDSDAITMPSLPGFPTGFSVMSATGSSITLGWSVAGGETGVVLTRGGSTIATLPVTTTSYTDTGLTPDSSYHYEISSYNAGGRSQSISLDADTLSDTPISINASATSGDAPLTVDFSITNTTGNAIRKCWWNFKDGNTLVGNLPSPSHTFTEDGTYNVTLSVRLKDSDGSFSTAVADPITIDVVGTATPPVLTISSPVDGHVFSGSPVTISGTVTDDVEVDKVRITVKVDKGTVYDTALATINGDTFDGIVDLREGSNKIHIWAFDTEGNSTHEYIGVQLNTIGPIANIVKGPYLQNVTQDSIVVMWETDIPTLTTLEYGSPPIQINLSPEKTIHEVELTGLTAGTTYDYRVGINSIGITWTPWSSFSTAPDAAGTFRMAVYGDSQDQIADHTAVVAAIKISSPDLVLKVGDNVDHGRVYEEWGEQFFQPTASLMIDTPLFSILGNHEYYDEFGQSGNPDLYYSLFSLPGNEQYYAFTYGCARIIGLDTNDNFSPGSAQYNWLLSEFQSAEYTQATWKFVYFHHPPYSSASGGSFDNGSVRTYLFPLFDQYGVTMVFSGHAHNYERLSRNGISYIVTGGGGATLRGFEAVPHPSSRVRAMDFHHCVLDITPTSLTYNVYDNARTVLDTLALTGGAAASKGSTEHTPQGFFVIDAGLHELDLMVVSSEYGNTNHFILERKKDGESAFQTIDVIAGGQPNHNYYYLDTNLISGTRYDYRICAYDGNGSKSEYLYADDATFPESVSNPNAIAYITNAGNAEVDLDWDPPAGNLDYYKIMREDINQTAFQEFIYHGSPPYLDKDPNLVPGEMYIYTIWCITENRRGDEKTGGWEICSVIVPPKAPKNFNAAATSISAVDITWDAVPKGDGYKIFREENGNEQEIADIADINETSYQDTGLNSGTEYLYKILAYADTEESSKETDYAATKPDALSSANVQVINGGPLGEAPCVEITWTYPAGGCSVDGFTITRSGGSGSWKKDVGASAISERDTTAVQGETYKYEIKSYIDTQNEGTVYSDPISTQSVTP